MKRVFFYAAPDDIRNLLTWYESQISIAYSPMGGFKTKQPVVFARQSEMDDLGIADHDQTSACKSYLVYPSDQTISPVSFVQDSGDFLYSFTQMENENTVVLRPAGVWDDDVCIYGEMSTLHDSLEARKLLRVFKKGVESSFAKVKSFWVGPKALEMLDAGKRLTMAVQSPPEYNLAR